LVLYCNIINGVVKGRNYAGDFHRQTPVSAQREIRSRGLISAWRPRHNTAPIEHQVFNLLREHALTNCINKRHQDHIFCQQDVVRAGLLVCHYGRVVRNQQGLNQHHYALVVCPAINSLAFCRLPPGPDPPHLCYRPHSLQHLHQNVNVKQLHLRHQHSALSPSPVPHPCKPSLQGYQRYHLHTAALYIPVHHFRVDHPRSSPA